MWATRRSVSGVPAPAGKEWRFEFPVGVDCSDPEPRCIWLAALRNLNVQHSHVRLTRRNMLQRVRHHVRSVVEKSCIMIKIIHPNLGRFLFYDQNESQ